MKRLLLIGRIVLFCACLSMAFGSVCLLIYSATTWWDTETPVPLIPFIALNAGYLVAGLVAYWMALSSLLPVLHRQPSRLWDVWFEYVLWIALLGSLLVGGVLLGDHRAYAGLATRIPGDSIHEASGLRKHDLVHASWLDTHTIDPDASESPHDTFWFWQEGYALGYRVDNLPEAAIVRQPGISQGSTLFATTMAVGVMGPPMFAVRLFPGVVISLMLTHLLFWGRLAAA